MRASFATIVGSVLAALAVLLAIEALVDLVLAQVVLLVLALVVLMAAGVFLRPLAAYPAAIDPFLLLCLFLGQFFVIGPIAMGLWGLSPIIFFRAPGMEQAIPPLLGCILMVLCVIVGYRVGLGAMIASRLPDFSRGAHKLPRRWAVSAVVAIGLAGSFWWIEYQGGLLAKLGMGYGMGKPGAAFTLVWNLLLLGTILWAWHLFDDDAPSRRQWLAFYSFLGFEAVFFGIILGVRKYFFFLFFGLLTCYALRRGIRNLPKLRTAVILSALLVFFAVWGSVRGIPVAAMLGLEEKKYHVEQTPYSEGYLSGVADPFGSAALIWQVFPEQESFRHGRTLLVTLLMFIPRAVWPDKPVGIGKELTRYYVGPFFEPTQGYSVTVTVPADLYVNFGWIGIAVGGFLLGVLCRVVASYAVTGMSGGVQRSAARVLIPVIFVMALGEIRADMAQMLALSFMTGVPLLGILLLFRMNANEPHAAEAAAGPARA